MPLNAIDLDSILARGVDIYRNLGAPHLIELAVAGGEGILTDQGALCVTTGRYTGRSPRDKFVVTDPGPSSHIDWGTVNQPMEPEVFEGLYSKALEHTSGRRLFVFDGFAGADTDYRLPVRVITELAWQSLFARQLLIRSSGGDLAGFAPEFTVLCLPHLKADPAADHTRSEVFIVISFERRLVLIGGTHYAGEIKKAIFTVLNYLLPLQGVFPMHCSANVSNQGEVALFFGLSGTGKTTLSADPNRRLIGDDEHGWSDRGIFNFEGGCYAKCIHLCADKEPQIWNAIRFGTVLENVAVDSNSRLPDYSSPVMTENTRAAYPVEFIPRAVIPGISGHPSVLIFLTADAFGVLPPVSRLTKEQAMYHFLSGYTSKLAGTERGVTTPQATFSPCFGGPFLPLSPLRYASMLGERMERHKVPAYLINTGWSGGAYGEGRRIPLKITRALVDAVLTGQLESAAWTEHPVFQVSVPLQCPGVAQELLDPRRTWADGALYDQQARQLAERFHANLTRFGTIPADIAGAGPRL